MPGRYSNYKVRENLSVRHESMVNMEKDPATFSKIKDKPAFLEQKERIGKQLETITPPDVTPETKSTLSRRLAMLEEAMVNGREGVVPPMTTQYQEEKVPAGAIGQGIVHDRFWKKHTLDENGKIVPVAHGGRGAKFEWKDLRRIVYKDLETDDPDVANLEMIRPAGRAAPLADVRLPQTFGLTPQARANYDQSFPDHQPTAVEKKLEGEGKQGKERMRNGRMEKDLLNS